MFSPDRQLSAVKNLFEGEQMRKLAGLSTCLSFFCAACVSIAELPESVQIQAPMPKDIRSAVIHPVPMKPGTMKNVDSRSDTPQVFAGQVKDALALRRPSWRIKVIGEGEPGAVGDEEIAVRIEFLEIDGGSAGLRFWIGFSAGATESLVRVSIIDRTGKDLASTKISERTMCPLGACVESNEASIRRNLQDLAVEVAEFITDPAGYQKKKASES
ncbi:MAG TPA: DUF4410 domain-containing protein [Candidatus Binatia bacterium]|jgi:hypothetical protein